MAPYGVLYGVLLAACARRFQMEVNVIDSACQEVRVSLCSELGMAAHPVIVFHWVLGTLAKYTIV